MYFKICCLAPRSARHLGRRGAAGAGVGDRRGEVHVGHVLIFQAGRVRGAVAGPKFDRGGRVGARLVASPHHDVSLVVEAAGAAAAGEEGLAGAKP